MRGSTLLLIPRQFTRLSKSGICVNATRDGAVAALQAAGLKHEVRTFPGADHAFFNDTGPRYNAAAATEAYQDVLDWFNTNLR